MPEPHIYIHTRDQALSLRERLQQLANYDPMAQLNGGPIYTYTHTRSTPEGPAEKPAAEAPERTGGHIHTQKYTHTQENDSPVTPEPEDTSRENRVNLGKNAEERVREILGIFGEATQGPGNWGQPDLVLDTELARYAVEVKTMSPMRRTNQQGYNGYKINQLTLNLEDWEALGRYAVEHTMSRILIVEVRINSPKGALYHVIQGRMVDRMAKPGAKWIGFSIYDLPALSQLSLRPGLPYEGRDPL